MTKNNKNPLPWLTILSVVAVIVLIILALLCDWDSLVKPYRLILFLLLLSMILFPSLKEFSIGNIITMKIKSLDNSVNQLKDTILNLSFNTTNTQTIINSDFPLPHGQTYSGPMIKEAKRVFDLARSLYNQKRYIESLKYFNKAFDLDRNNWVSAMYLGFIYLSISNLNINQDQIGITRNQTLEKSIFYSSCAVDLDPNHFNQYMNLGIAQMHFDSNILKQSGIINLQIVIDMISNDKKANSDPGLFIQKCKCATFIGEIYEKLEDFSKSRSQYELAMTYYDICPTPLPLDYEKWKNDTIIGLKRANNKLTT